MSLLSTFLAKSLVPALEAAFVAHEPDAQALLLSEIQHLSESVSSWLLTKATPTNPPSA